MSWTLKRHFVAKKVLAKHQGDLDKQHAQLDSFRKEDVRDIHKDLRGLGSPRKKPTARRGTLPEVGIQQSLLLSTHVGARQPHTERLERNSGTNTYSYSRRRQSEPTADLTLSRLGAGDLSNQGCRLLEPEVNAEFQQFLQRSKLGVYGKENQHGERRRSLEDISEVDGFSSASEINKLKLENTTSESSRNPQGQVDILNLEEEGGDGREFHSVDALSLENRLPSYARSGRRMSLPPNGSVIPKHVIENSLKANVSKGRDRRASFSSGNISNQKYLHTRRGSWNHPISEINVTFVDEYTGEADPGRYMVPNTYRGNPCDEATSKDDVTKLPKMSEEEKKIWGDVARCRYIRGYDPPEMKMPNCEPNVFVFGRNLGESIEASLSEQNSTDPLETPRIDNKF